MGALVWPTKRDWHTYSSGMLLRLVFAVPTVRQRDILLLDELIGTGGMSFAAKARQRIENMMTARTSWRWRRTTPTSSSGIATGFCRGGRQRGAHRARIEQPISVGHPT